MILDGDLAVKYVSKNDLKLRRIEKKSTIISGDKYPSESLDDIIESARQAQTGRAG
jgi:hypothetical protein